MRRAAIVLGLLALSWALMSSSHTWRRNVARRKLGQLADARSQTVDMGILLRVVRQDLAHGTELIPDSPPLVAVREHRLGGTVSLAGRPHFIGPSVSPAVMYCSEESEPLILHGDELPDRLLVYGSEGAGKTRVLAQWILVRALEATGTGHIIGATSPTGPRSKELLEAFRDLWPSEWWSWHEKAGMVNLRNGVRVQITSTHQPTRKTGSRIQGFNWRCAASDEIQDSLERDADIEMRGRKAPLGRYKRLCTATSKDSSDFREWRDKRLATGMWAKRTLLGRKSPFIWARFWDDKIAAGMSRREARRRIDAEDLPPENRVYYGFDRDRNIIVAPEVARNITAQVLGAFRSYSVRGATFELLAGHDPGEIRNVTHCLQAFWFRDHVLWLVVGRYISERTTAEQHAAGFRRYVQQEFGCNYERDAMDPDAGLARVLVMCDPHGRGESKTDYQTVHGAFQRERLDIFNAAGSESVIHSKARRNMMNALMDPEPLYGRPMPPPRLCIARTMGGDLAAPELVKALETLEVDESGRAEKERKSETDQTHHPVSVGYALWPFEAPGVSAYTLQRAQKAVAA